MESPATRGGGAPEKREGAASLLSPQALDILRSLDSLSYGLLDLHSNGRSTGREATPLFSLSRNVIKQGITHLQGSVASLSCSPHSQAQLISQIGHLHLLLEEFADAYSAYSHYRRLSPSSDSDPALFYGLGMIYSHQSHFKESEEAYQRVLSLSPSFPRSGEVHLRLGLLLKRRRVYTEALSHLETALSKPDPQLDKMLVQFHIAHLCQLQGQGCQARAKFEVLLSCRSLSTHIRSLTQKQLGWLLHKAPETMRLEGVKEEGDVRGRAVELLRQAVQGLPECGETWYLLGRVLVTGHLYHEAFTAYQKAIKFPSKVCPANVWHSIGHLYFQMQQPRDSLQAYLCCVYLEIHHLQGWKSLGCLYEAVVYPVQALLCYKNAMVAYRSKIVLAGKDMDYVQSRISALMQYLGVLGGRTYVQNSGMPLLHDAWTTLVPEHIRRKQPMPGNPILTLDQFYGQAQESPSLSTPLPLYPPPPSPITPSLMMRAPGNLPPGNFVPPTMGGKGRNEGKPPRKKKAKKKPSAVKWSCGSASSPTTFMSPVHSTFTSPDHSTPTQLQPPQNVGRNGNQTPQQNGTGVSLMECNQNGMETAPSEPRVASSSSGADLDLNGLNLDNLDYDALAVAASAIPSPASLAARSHVRVSVTTQPRAAAPKPSPLSLPPGVSSGSPISSTFPSSSPPLLSALTSPSLSTSTTLSSPPLSALSSPPLSTVFPSSSSSPTSTLPVASLALSPTNLSNTQLSGPPPVLATAVTPPKTAAMHPSPLPLLPAVPPMSSPSSSVFPSSTHSSSASVFPTTTPALPSAGPAHPHLPVVPSSAFPTTSPSLRSAGAAHPNLNVPVVLSSAFPAYPDQPAVHYYDSPEDGQIPHGVHATGRPSNSGFADSSISRPHTARSVASHSHTANSVASHSHTASLAASHSHTANSVASLYQNSLRTSDSRTPDMESSQHASQGSLNWPSYLVPGQPSNTPSNKPPSYSSSVSGCRAKQPTHKLTSPRPQAPPTTGPPALPLFHTEQTSSLAPSISTSQTRPANSLAPHLPTGASSSSASAAVRSSSLSQERGRVDRPASLLPRKRRSTAKALSETSLSRSKRRSESSFYNLAQSSQASLVQSAPSSVGAGSSRVTSPHTTPLLPPLPPHMASDASFLSQLTSSSHPCFPPSSTCPNMTTASRQTMPLSTTSATTHSGSFFAPTLTTASRQTMPLSTTSATPHSGSSFAPTLTTTSRQTMPLSTTSATPHSGSSFAPTLTTASRQTMPLSTTSATPHSGSSFAPTLTTTSRQTMPLSTTSATPHSGSSFAPTLTTASRQTMPLSTTSATPHSGSSFAPSGCNQTIPLSIATPPNGMSLVPNGYNHSHFAPLATASAMPRTTTPQSASILSHTFNTSINEQIVLDKSRISSEKDLSIVQSNVTSPFHIYTSQVPATLTSPSGFYSTTSSCADHAHIAHQEHHHTDHAHTAHQEHHHTDHTHISYQEHHHTDHTHRDGKPADWNKIKSKTIHHFAPTRLSTSPLSGVPPASGIPRTSPPHPSVPLTSHRQSFSPTSLPAAALADLPLFSPPARQPSSATDRPGVEHPLLESPTVSLSSSQERAASVADITTNLETRQGMAQSLPVHEQPSPIAMSCLFPTQPDRTGSQPNQIRTQLSPTEGYASQQFGRPASAQVADSSSPSSLHAVSSVQSLVNQLFAVLQKDGTSAHMPLPPDTHSDTSSGISSAGTKLSTSSAEFSPLDPSGQCCITTHSLPLYSPPSSLPSLPPSFTNSFQPPSVHAPPSPPSLSPPSPPSPYTTNRTTMQPHQTHCGFSPLVGTNYNAAKPVQNMTEETENKPPMSSHYQHHQSNSHLKQSVKSRERSTSGHPLVNLSNLIVPRVPFPSLGSAEEYMILEPELSPPSRPPFQAGMELLSQCPVYEVTSFTDAMSSSLHEFCNNPSLPICIIRGLSQSVGLDLSLFSSQSLVDTCPDHEMEVREQMKQAPDENCDVMSRKQIWRCESSKSVTTVIEYARYQQKKLEREAEGDHSDYLSDRGLEGEKREREILSFGTNVDLSDGVIWSEQLMELNKLPQFLRVNCPESNLLSHIGHTVLGMNSVQLYMKVAGSRTPGHQENNNFCSVNINIGPGDCEWFAVPNSYWGLLHSLCEKHKVNFLVGSWWPILDELYRHKVPVYRFTQYQGDMVYINPGTVHWVQANSTCNNIAWNTGPLTAHQFRMAWERYQWNRVQKVRSIVPMIHLTWNLAQNIRITDSHFYAQVRSLLESSLAQTRLLVSHLQKAGIPVVWHGRMDGEPAPYCNSCMEEVFNILFVLSHRGEYLVYCHRCASSMRKTFTVLQQYATQDLEEVVASFRLHPPEL